jgi:hypothetical protein
VESREINEMQLAPLAAFGVTAQGVTAPNINIGHFLIMSAHHLVDVILAGS